MRHDPYSDAYGMEEEPLRLSLGERVLFLALFLLGTALPVGLGALLGWALS